MEALNKLLLFAPPFLVSLTFHEFAHAWAANRLGDSTAKVMGRLTMDPMVHISWVGTVILPAFAVLTGAPLFGWANPVPVDMRNFKRPRSHMAIVAAAGPASNVLLALIFAGILAVVVRVNPQTAGLSGMAEAGVTMLVMAIQLNLFLAVFNMLPIPPLDGSRIVQGFVAEQAAQKIDEWGAMGSWLILILFLAGFMKFLAAPVYAMFSGLLGLVGVSG